MLNTHSVTQQYKTAWKASCVEVLWQLLCWPCCGACPAVLCCVLCCAVLCVAGGDAAVSYVAGSGLKLCALGADGQVLQQAGLKVRHSTHTQLWGAAVLTVVVCCAMLWQLLCYAATGWLQGEFKMSIEAPSAASTCDQPLLGRREEQAL